MKILAIETSCDETAISIIEASGDFSASDFNILSNTIHSQIEMHREYGGVYPNLAKREHGRNLVPVLMQSLTEAFGKIKTNETENTKFSKSQTEQLKNIFEHEPELLENFLEELPKIQKPDTRPVRDSEDSQRESSNGIDAIAVTYGPGLEPALWVGINFAKALALVWNIPIIPTNHMEGHIFSAFMQGEKFSIQNTSEKFPMLALLVSGGHTELILIKDWLEYEKIGQTRDDAVGEAFDKVARILGLPYPGGPEISKLAENFEGGGLTSRSPEGGERSDLEEQNFQLPRPMINSNDFDFSFSGLKTAVLYMVKKIPDLTPQIKADIAKEFQQAVIDVLVSKTIKAGKTHGAKTILIGGGVSANKELRAQLGIAIEKELPTTNYKLPTIDTTGDNASMIAVAGYFKYLKKDTPTTSKTLPDQQTLSAQGNLSL